jgi:hypothetical protein
VERRRGAAAHVASQAAAAAADAVHAAHREAAEAGRLRAEEAEAEAARCSALRARVEVLLAWARSHCRVMLSLLQFIPDSLTYSVPLLLKRQRGWTLGAVR